MRPLAISFDLDNTLFDRRLSLRVFAAKLMAEFSTNLLEVSEQTIFSAIVDADGDGYPLRQQAMMALNRAPLWRIAPDPDCLWEFWSGAFPTSVVPYEDMRSTLEELANRGMKLVIVSNGWSSLQRQKLRTLGIETLFDAVLIGEEVGVEKPNVGVFERVSRELKILPGRIWHVGDDPVNDVLASSRAGLQAVWFAHTRKWPVDAAQPSISIDALAELVSLLDRS